MNVTTGDSSFRATGLHKTFGSLQVTTNVNLELPRGCRHGLIGPNGAGKTTLFNLLSGELQPDAGRILLGNQDLTRASPDARARAGLARSFQRNNLFNEMSVRQNIALACAVQDGVAHVFWRSFAGFRTVHATAREHAEQLGLVEELDTPVRHLSYGTQRQLEIGLALARKPRVLLLDEPTSGMSPEETVAIRRLLNTLPEELIVLVIEHDMDVIFDIADRITVLDYGRVLLEGTPSAVRNSPEVRARYFGEQGPSPAGDSNGRSAS